jgi:hypothetical protein
MLARNRTTWRNPILKRRLWNSKPTQATTEAARRAQTHRRSRHPALLHLQTERRIDQAIYVINHYLGCPKKQSHPEGLQSSCNHQLGSLPTECLKLQWKIRIKKGTCRCTIQIPCPKRKHFLILALGKKRMPTVSYLHLHLYHPDQARNLFQSRPMQNRNGYYHQLHHDSRGRNV